MWVICMPWAEDHCALCCSWHSLLGVHHLRTVVWVAARPAAEYPATGPSPPSSPAAGSSRIMRHEKAAPKHRHRLPAVRRASADPPVDGFLQPSPSLHVPGSPLISSTPSSTIPAGFDLPPHLRGLQHLAGPLSSQSEQHRGQGGDQWVPPIGHPVHKAVQLSGGPPQSSPNSPQHANGWHSSVPHTPLSVSPDPSRLPPGVHHPHVAVVALYGQGLGGPGGRPSNLPAAAVASQPLNVWFPVLVYSSLQYLCVCRHCGLAGTCCRYLPV